MRTRSSSSLSRTGSLHSAGSNDIISDINPFSGVKVPQQVFQYKGRGRFAFTKESKTAIKQAASIMMFGPVIGMWFATNTTYGQGASKKTAATQRSPRNAPASAQRNKKAEGNAKPVSSERKPVAAKPVSAPSPVAQRTAPSTVQITETKAPPKKQQAAPKASGAGGSADKPFKLATASVDEIQGRLFEALPQWKALVEGQTAGDSASLFLCCELTEDPSANAGRITELAQALSSTKPSNEGEMEQLGSQWLEGQVELTAVSGYSPDQLDMQMLSQTLSGALTETLLND